MLKENAIRLEEKETREKELLYQIIDEADEYKVEFYRKMGIVCKNNKATNWEKEKIWQHADQTHTSFLGRQEFYNALRLVTVAQSKRELTPDIVKAALYGPTAAKIPAPQIYLPATPTHQINSMAATSATQMGAVAPIASQNFGFRGTRSSKCDNEPGLFFFSAKSIY